MALTKEGKPVSREDFHKMAEDAQRQKRVEQAEANAREQIIQQNKTVIAPVYSKSEKDKEKRSIEKMLRAGFDSAGIQFKATGKTGEYAIRLPTADYTVKITRKKEKVEALDR